MAYYLKRKTSLLCCVIAGEAIDGLLEYTKSVLISRSHLRREYPIHSFSISTVTLSELLFSNILCTFLAAIFIQPGIFSTLCQYNDYLGLKAISILSSTMSPIPCFAFPITKYQSVKRAEKFSPDQQRQC